MKPYELLEHTADAKFRAYGKTKEEAFANAVKGMTAIVKPPEEVKDHVMFPVEVAADDLKKLLFDFLDQTLFMIDTEKFLPARAENLVIKETDGNYTLKATLLGEEATEGNLKAVTYHDMLCEEQDGQWIIQVVIDI